MALGKEEIKMYLRIDGVLEDALLDTFKAAAENYLQEAGIKKDYEGPTYKLAVLMLITHFYENRGVVTEGRYSTSEIPFGLKALIQQLQFTVKESEVPSEN
jgi:uncharacterized phage protein (predicted DNA packaging)